MAQRYAHGTAVTARSAHRPPPKRQRFPLQVLGIYDPRFAHGDGGWSRLRVDLGYPTLVPAIAVRKPLRTGDRDEGFPRTEPGHANPGQGITAFGYHAVAHALEEFRPGLGSHQRSITGAQHAQGTVALLHGVQLLFAFGDIHHDATDAIDLSALVPHRKVALVDPTNPAPAIDDSILDIGYQLGAGLQRSHTRQVVRMHVLQPRIPVL